MQYSINLSFYLTCTAQTVHCDRIPRKMRLSPKDAALGAHSLSFILLHVMDGLWGVGTELFEPQQPAATSAVPAIKFTS